MAISDYICDTSSVDKRMKKLRRAIIISDTTILPGEDGARERGRY